MIFDKDIEEIKVFMDCITRNSKDAKGMENLRRLCQKEMPALNNTKLTSIFSLFTAFHADISAKVKANCRPPNGAAGRHGTRVFSFIESMDLVIEKINSGYCFNDLEASYGVSRTTIRKYLTPELVEKLFQNSNRKSAQTKKNFSSPNIWR